MCQHYYIIFLKIFTEIKKVLTIYTILDKNFLQMDLLMYVLRAYINRTLPINILTIKIKKKILTINKYTVSSLNFFNRREHIELISNSEVCVYMYMYVYINNMKSVQFTINIKQYGFHTKLPTDYKHRDN